MPDSVIKWVNVWAENDNVAEGWKFLNQTVVPFGFHDYMAKPLVSPIPTKYHEILAELPGVITEANTTQHEHDDEIQQWQQQRMLALIIKEMHQPAQM